MLERALAAGLPASWVTADEVYGGDPALRVWLKDHSLSYVLAVKGIVAGCKRLRMTKSRPCGGCRPPSAPSRSSRSFAITQSLAMTQRMSG
jgi:SRSO17 transposase